MQANSTENDLKSKNLAVVICLVKDDKDFLFGALRQIQLANIYFPKWISKLYIPINIPNEKELVIPENLIRKMKSLGAEIVYIDMKAVNIPLSLISFLIVDESDVENFIVRNARQRINECDVIELQNFRSTNKSAHLITRDNSSNNTFLTERWEGNSEKLRKKIHENYSSMKQFIQVCSDLHIDTHIQIYSNITYLVFINL